MSETRRRKRLNRSTDELFTEFYWGVLRIVHQGCPFIQLSKGLNLVIRPRFFEMRVVREYVPFYTVLDRFIIPDEFTETFESLGINNLEINRLAPDFSRQRTLIIGKTRDDIINAIIKDPKLDNLANKVYARPDYEYIPIQTMNREDLYSIEQSVRELVNKYDGDASLDTVGKVTSIRDLIFWQESLGPEPTIVPGLSLEETRILEAAISYGYYQIPRKVTLQDLAEKLSIPKSTMAERLRIVENRIVNTTLSRQVGR